MSSTMKILAAEHPIKSVTVFKSSKAEIVRTFALELKAGQNRIRITGLPGVIDPDSIRVSGLGQARLFDIVCTTGNSCESDSEDGDDDESDDDDEDDDGDQDYEDATAGEVARGKSKKPKDKQKSALEVLRRLNIKKSDLEAEKKVFEEELNLRSRYAKTLSAEHINPIEAKNYFNGFSDAMCSTLDDISKLNRKIVKVDRQIIRQTAKTQLKKGWTMGEVVVVVGADEKDNVELKLTYIVGNVSWEPTYTLHASTENGKPSSTVTLQYRARVKQSTGEDWTDTALTLSTVASDATTQSIPHLKSMEIRPQLFKRDGFLRFAQQQQQQQLPSFGTTGFGAVAPPVQSQSQSQAANLSQTQQSRFAGFRQHPIQSTFAQQGVQNPAANPPQQPFGPFGSAAANPLQQSSGLFGSAPANPLQQSSGLFGSASANPPQPSGLFGQPAAANPPQQSNVFGQPAPQNPVANPPQPSGLFGQPPSQNQQQAGFFGQSVETAQNYTSSPDYNVIVPADDDSFEDVAVPGPSESTTIVSESPLAISYGVTGKATIPSDGIAHQVSIAVLPFESKITHVTIPRIKPNVYLQCEVKNTSEYRLLPGFVTVILDDSYVSKTSISDINTGDVFHCTLGVDSATKVSYSRSSRTVRSVSGSFAEATNTTIYTSKTTIHNKHAFAISDLIVRDVVPMSGDKRVKVILRKPEGLADARDGVIVDLKQGGLKARWEKLVDGKGGEKEGKFEWTWKVDSGAQIKLEAEWEVKAPADVTWVESVVSN